MDGDTQASWAALLGFQVDKLSDLTQDVLRLSMATEYMQAINTWQVGEAAATFSQKAAATYAFETATARQEPPAVAGTALPDKPAVPDKGSDGNRRVKASSVIDTTDDSEVPFANPSQIAQWYSNYRDLKHGDPLPDKEPSPDQISAMNQRVVILKLEPYADFSILTPYGRRAARAMRHRSWILQEDGTYKPMEVPGPGSFEAWDACFKVYEVIMLMLRYPRLADDTGSSAGTEELVVTPIALEAYHEAFSALAREHPECWHLCQKAEDRCRAEHFPRLARKLRAQDAREASWSEIFTEAAQDDRYWDREVRRPAYGFLARGKRGSAMQEQYDKRSQASHSASPQGPAEPPKKLSRNDKKKVKVGGKASGDAKGGKGGGKGAHPRQDAKGRYMSTRDGTEICFKFANGDRDACPSPCPRARAHVCQICLQPHSNARCTKSV